MIEFGVVYSVFVKRNPSSVEDGVAPFLDSASVAPGRLSSKTKVESMSTSQGKCVGIGLLLLGIVGCSAASAAPEEDLVSVSGQVLFGDKPAEGVLVNFIPSGTTNNAHRGTAVTDADGQFEMLNYQNKEGMPPGTYVVVFTCWRLPDGSLPPADVPPATSQAIQIIPSNWRDVPKAGPHNTVIVPDDGKSGLVFKIPKT